MELCATMGVSIDHVAIEKRVWYQEAFPLNMQIFTGGSV